MLKKEKCSCGNIATAISQKQDVCQRCFEERQKKINSRHKAWSKRGHPKTKPVLDNDLDDIENE